jgi:hypothetical protein
MAMTWRARIGRLYPIVPSTHLTPLPSPMHGCHKTGSSQLADSQGIMAAGPTQNPNMGPTVPPFLACLGFWKLGEQSARAPVYLSFGHRSVVRRSVSFVVRPIVYI